MLSSAVSHDGDSPRNTKCSSSSVFMAMDRFIQSANNLEATVLIPSRLKDMAPPMVSVAPLSLSAVSSTLNRHRCARLKNNHSSRSSPPPSYAPSPAFSSVSSDASSSLLSPAFSPLAQSPLSSSSLSPTTTCPHELYHMLKDVKKELLWGPTILNASLGLDLLAYQKPIVKHHHHQQQQYHLYPPHPQLLHPALQQLTHSPSLHCSTTQSTSSSQNLTHLNHHNHHHSVLMLRDSDRSDDSAASSTTTSTSQSTSTSSSVSASTDDDQAGSMLLSTFRYHLHSLHNMLHQLADSADQLSYKYVEEVENCRNSR